jgi:hypothetical protein
LFLQEIATRASAEMGINLSSKNEPLAKWLPNA